MKNKSKILSYLATLIIISSLFIIKFSKPKTFSFKAHVETLNYNSILISTNDNVGFTEATVEINKNTHCNFQLKKNQQIIIEALEDIKETSPVQLTATKIIKYNN